MTQTNKLAMVAVIAAVCALTSILASAQQRETAPIPTWEYKIIQGTMSLDFTTSVGALWRNEGQQSKVEEERVQTEARFNALGTDGWELVATTSTTAVFKRQGH